MRKRDYPDGAWESWGDRRDLRTHGMGTEAWAFPYLVGAESGFWSSYTHNLLYMTAELGKG